MMTLSGVRVLLLLIVLLCVGLLAVPTLSRADTLDTFVNLYSEIEQAPGVAGTLPVSSQDLKDSKSFIRCLGDADSDLAIAVCIDNAQNSPLGKNVSSQGGIPSSVWMVLDSYIYYRSGDYWSAAYSLGEAAVCAALQILAGGAIDVCGLIQDLIKLGKALLNAATAVAEFLASAGSAVVSAIESAGCDLVGWGCDEGPPPPVTIYNLVFAPQVDNGLKAIESDDFMAFSNLVTQLKEKAAKLTFKFGIPPQEFAYNFGAGDINIAADVYRNTVDAQWTADVAKNALPALTMKRQAYNSPQQISQAASAAIASYFALPYSQPGNLVANRCTDEFKKNFGFAHVDRWLSSHDASAMGSPKSNSTWCAASFWGGNKPEFGSRFSDYLKQHGCAPFGQGMMCSTITPYEACLDLMGSVGGQSECGINTATAGKEAAQKIVAEFKNRGSKHYTECSIKSGNSFISSQPVNLTCPRPVLKHYCEEYYQSWYGALPVKLLNCLANPDSSYLTLKTQVAQQIPKLNAAYGAGSFGPDQIDPLIIGAAQPILISQVQESQWDYPFDFSALSVPRPVDGVDQGTIAYQLQMPKPPSQLPKDSIKEQIEGLKPGDPDPFNQGLQSHLNPLQVSPDVMLSKGQLQTQLGALAQGQGQMKTMSGQLPSGSLPGAPGGQAGLSAKPAQVQATGENLPNLPAGPQGQPLTPTSFKLPGQGGETVPKAVSGLVTLALPDLTLDSEINIGGIRSDWRGRLALDDGKALQAGNGRCSFDVKYTLRNLGPGVVGPFVGSWRNSSVAATTAKSWPGLAPGASLFQSEVLDLQPGQNILEFRLDPEDRIKETNEANNRFPLIIFITGQCLAPRSGLSAGGAPGASMTRGPQLPAVQTPNQGAASGAPTLIGQAPLAALPALPDLTTDGPVNVAGKPVRWGMTLALDARESRQSANGACIFPVQYVVKNTGNTGAKPFQSSWGNSAVPPPMLHSWGPLASGTSAGASDNLTLKPGQNILSLTIDSLGQVQESNEGNNRFRLIINLTGQCGATPQRLVPVPVTPLQRNLSN